MSTSEGIPLQAVDSKEAEGGFHTAHTGPLELDDTTGTSQLGSDHESMDEDLHYSDNLDCQCNFVWWDLYDRTFLSHCGQFRVISTSPYVTVCLDQV